MNRKPISGVAAALLKRSRKGLQGTSGEHELAVETTVLGYIRRTSSLDSHTLALPRYYLLPSSKQ